MENFNFIYYHRSRDFGRKLNATFEFIKQNFKSLIKCLFVIVAPSTLMAGVVFGNVIDDLQMQNQNQFWTDNTSHVFMMMGQMILAFILLIVSAVLSVATLHNYVILYEEKQTNKISVTEVWDRVKSTFFKYVLASIIYVVLMGAMYLILIVPSFLFASVHPGLMIFFVFGIMFAMVYLLIASSLSFFLISYEKLNFFEALTRSIKLTYGKWWSTFGVLLVLQIIAGFASYIFLIPFYIVVFLSSMHGADFESLTENLPIIMSIFLTLYLVAQMILSILPQLGLVFQYFNLVEMKEAKGLMSRIDTLGSYPTASNQSTDSEETY
jgi:hypothetical protein